MCVCVCVCVCVLACVYVRVRVHARMGGLVWVWGVWYFMHEFIVYISRTWVLGAE